MSEVRPEDIQAVAASVPPEPVPVVTEQPAAPEPPIAETPAPAPEPAPPDTPPAEPPVYDPAEGTLRATEPAKTEGEEKKPEDAAKVEEPPAPVEEILKYEFNLPEGMEIPEERAVPLTEWLIRHKVPLEDAQSLMDMHTSAMKEYADHLVAEQWRSFNQMNADKRAEIMADPVLGGAGYKTNQNAVAAMIDMLIPEEKRKAFNDRMAAGGMLDDIEFFRMMVTAARRFGEPAAPPPDAAPVPNGAGRSPPGSGGSMYTYPRGNSGR